MCKLVFIDTCLLNSPDNHQFVFKIKPRYTNDYAKMSIIRLLKECRTIIKQLWNYIGCLTTVCFSENCRFHNKS